MDAIKQILRLEKPVKIKFLKKDHPYWDACYIPRFDKWGDVKSHYIKIYNNPQRERTVDELIAHELIHAWQEEQELADIHGKPFQKMARRITREFPNLKNIYDKKVDLE